MAQDKIRALSISGLRSIADLTLNLDGLTVLVGDNGSGKSSIIEACELFRRIGEGQFLSEFSTVHGGFPGLLRRSGESLGLIATVEAEDHSWSGIYSVIQAPKGPPHRIYEGFVAIESLGDARRPWRIFERTGTTARVWNGTELISVPAPKRSDLLLNELSGALAPHPAIPRVRDALASIEVHLPFEVTPAWASRAHQRPSASRGTVLLQPAERLETFGKNLANAFFTLRNEHSREHWEATMDLVRLGLGGQIESVNTRADPGGGSVALTVKLAGHDELLPAHALSDGQLAYLCFVALYRLHADRSLLAFDEPELHMHPELLVRVVQLFEDMATRHPVILATHSDVLLDALSEPAKSVRVCELRDGQTRLRQLDEPALRTWMERYRGVGQLRSEGHLPALLTDEAPQAPSNVVRDLLATEPPE